MSTERLAIDVVLLPPQEIMEKAIHINKRLIQEVNPDKIILGTRTGEALPHETLAMGVLKRESLEQAKKRILEIAERHQPLASKIIDLPAHPTPNGDSVCEFLIEKSSGHEALHEDVMRTFGDLLTYDGAVKDLYPQPEPEDITLHWINNFKDKSSGENFRPHITLGFGEASMDQPFSFTASRLALCHLGNYCTCREILVEVALDGSTS